MSKMGMKYIGVIIICFLIMSMLGCYQNDDISAYNDISLYNGIWRDTLYSDSNVYIEDLTIKENSINYSLFNSATHVVFDTLIGIIVIGNENKIGWNCISPINNKTRQNYWDILDLSLYQMTLYSNTYGVRNYKKVHYSTIEEERIQDRLQNIVRDTLMEMLQYQDYLPLHKNDLIAKFGDYNRLGNCNGIAYFTHHSLLDKILFTENLDNDSIYSYSLIIREKNWCKCDSIICSNYMKLRNINGTTEYTDADKLENSNNVIIVDSVSRCIKISPIKDYDFWPNVSRYLNMTIQDVKSELAKKYVYIYQLHHETGLHEYQFQTSKDSLCSTIGVMSDSEGIIQSCSVSLLKQYMLSKITEAKKEEEETALFLKKKYYFDKEKIDEKTGDKVYYFYPCNPMTDSKFEIILRLRYYQNGISNLCNVTIDFNTL